MTPYELWEKFQYQSPASQWEFLAALREYGAEVRKRDAEICLDLPLTEDDVDDLAEEVIHCKCAAAIGREPLP